MQFQVPQFIEVEDKIIGPLTFRQFLYLAGGAGLSFIFYVYLPIYISIFFIIASISLALALTFYRYNGRDFIYLTESMFKYALTKKLYLWKKTEPQTIRNKADAQVAHTPSLDLPRLSESKLRELSWSLDVRDQNKLNQQEDNGL